MERAPFDIEGGHLRVADPDPLRIGPCVEFAAHGQSGRRCRGRDRFHHGQGASERLTTPVLSDMAEQTMLDLVPLRCSGRVMADLKGHPWHDIIVQVIRPLFCPGEKHLGRCKRIFDETTLVGSLKLDHSPRNRARRGP